MPVNDPNRSPLRINRLAAATTPTGFAELVSDDFPVFHQSSRADLSHRTRAMLNSGKEEGEDASEEDD